MKTVDPPARAAHRSRRGGVLLEDLLTVSVVAIGCIVAAYVYMPDFERGARTLVHEVGEWVQGW